jgi:hypothetical protein
MDFSHNTSTKHLKLGAHILTCNHNSAPAGSVQNPTVLSPTLLPLNPFQAFVLHGTWAGGTTRPNNSDLYPCWSTFGELKPPTNERPATYHTRTPFSPQLRRCIVVQLPQSTSLKRLAGFDLSSVATTRRQVVDWFKNFRCTSLPIATGLPEGCSWFLMHIGRPCTHFTSVCTTSTSCAYSIRSCLCSFIGGGNWIPRISSHSGTKKE